MAWTHPPPHVQYSGGGWRAGLLPDLVRQVEPLGQESQRARLPRGKDWREEHTSREERLEVRSPESRPREISD